MFWLWKKKSDEQLRRLIETRKINIAGNIDDKFAQEVVKDMILLEENSVSQDIILCLQKNNSAISSIFTIHDNIKHLKAPVSIIAEEDVSGLSTLLLSSGTRGKRYACINCKISLLPVAQLAIDLTKEDEAYLVSMTRKIYEILCKNTNQPYYKIENDSKSLIKLNALEAQKYGIIDKVISRN